MTAFGLPLGHEMVITKPCNSIRKLVLCVAPTWKGKRLTVVYATSVSIRVNLDWPRVFVLSLLTGEVTLPEVGDLPVRPEARSKERRSPPKGVAREILPGQAIVTMTGKGRDLNTANPTFYLHALTDDPTIQGHLDVGKDAFQGGTHGMETIKLAREGIPLTAALYMTLLAREASYLANTFVDEAAGE